MTARAGSPVPGALLPLLRPILFGALFAAFLGGTEAWAASPQAPETSYFRIGTGTSSGTYFVIGGLIASAISDPPGAGPCEHGGSCGVPGLIAVAQATSGGIENLERLRSGALEAALVQTNIASWAAHGVEIYRHEPPFASLRAIATLYTETVQIVVRADGPLHTLGDLPGRTISVGERGSAIAADAGTILNTLGLPEHAYHPVFLRPGASVDQLVEGRLDALFIVGGAPFAAIDDAAARLPIRLLPIALEEARQLHQTQPFFAPAVIPSGVYAGVPETATLGVGALLAVRADLDADLAYGITRALWHPDTRRALAEGFPRGRFLPLDAAQDQSAVPLHPGAARYYHDIEAVARQADQASGGPFQPPARTPPPPGRPGQARP